MTNLPVLLIRCLLLLMALSQVLARPASAQSEEVSTSGPAEHVQALFDQAEQHRRAGRYETAEAAWQEGLSLCRRQLGAEHACVARGASGLGDVYARQQRYVEAEARYKQALAVYEAMPDGHHADVVYCLEQLIDVYEATLRMEEAAALYERLLAAQEAVLGKGSSEVHGLVSELASLYLFTGNVERLEQLLVTHADHPDRDVLLGVLQSVHMFVEGDPGSAERVGAMRAEQAGDHSMSIFEAVMLAAQYDDQGDPARADSLLARTQARAGDAETDELFMLAGIYERRGDHARADAMIARIEASDKPLGPDQMEGLATYYERRGDHARAEALRTDERASREAASQEKERGAEGDAEAAVRAAYEAILASQQAAMGGEPGSGRTASAADGPGEEASPFAEALLTTREGEMEEFAAVMAALSTDLDPTLEKARAGDMAARDELIRNGRLFTRFEAYLHEMAMAMGFGGPSSPFMAAQRYSRGNAIKAGLMRLAVEMPNDEAVVRAAFWMDLNGRGRSLDMEVRRRASPPEALSATEGAAPPELLQAVARITGSDGLDELGDGVTGAAVMQLLDDSLRTLSRRISALTHAGPGSEGGEGHAFQLALLHEKHKKAADILREWNFRDVTSVVEVDDVVRELPDGSAFVGYTFLSPDGAEVRTTSDAFGYRYAAFVLRPDGAVRFHALGDGARIDSLVVAYRQSMARFDPSRMGADQQRRDEVRLKTIARQLHDELVAPLTLDDAQTLFVALEGLLNVLPFEVLVDADGAYLLDRHRFAYLNSGRDLLEMRQRHHENGLMYVFADPDFETSPAESTYEQAPVPPQDGSAVRSADLTSARFERLAGTAAEAQVVADLFDLDERHLFRGAYASEAHFVNLPAPWRLHVATHGFFLADQPRPENPFSIGYPLQQTATGPLARYESPLLRSGLALAGANRVGQARAEEGYDGIVTAYEVANLNLQSTDLVVLSACETGVGTVRNGEGVFGLRRAFRMAGARTLVMSLWSVSDAATQEIMTEFYTRLKQGQTKVDALREAAMVLRAREDYAHPYYWGAFVLSGDPD